VRVKIVRIADRGVGNLERLHLSVLADTNAAYYAVFQTVAITAQSVRALPGFAYWFTNVPLRAGDNLILYSGHGKQASESRPDGGTDHFFFCGLPKTIWHEPNTRAVLLEINAWETGV
jgi:hypothetical protein